MPGKAEREDCRQLEPRDHGPDRHWSRHRADRYRVLGIYLNDHLAGATAGTELAHRVARTHRMHGQGGQLKRLAVEIAQDRAALISMMKALGIPVRAYKVCAAWIGEKPDG